MTREGGKGPARRITRDLYHSPGKGAIGLPAQGIDKKTHPQPAFSVTARSYNGQTSRMSGIDTARMSISSGRPMRQ